MESDAAKPPKNGDQTTERDQGIEAGLFAGIREWIDLIPWIRLGRTMRMAGSPLTLLSVFAPLVLVHLGLLNLVGDGPEAREGLGCPVTTLLPSIQSLGDLSWLTIVCVGMFLTPTVLLLMRQGAVLVAGRSMSGAMDTLRHAVLCAPKAWLAAIVPALCCLPFAVAIYVISLVFNWCPDVAFFQWCGAILLTLVGLPCGILLFGALIAVPLSWSAIVNEPNSDVLDSLSRGYEYFYRRPIQFLMYIVVSAVIVLIAVLIAGAVAMVAGWAILMISGPNAIAGQVSQLLALFALSIAFTMTFGLIGGMYLLLRSSAGGQEPEDLWAGPAKPVHPLPNLELE